MIITLNIFESNGVTGIKSYIDASNELLEGITSSLPDHFTPKIKSECPLCHRSGCAKWKGYYKRQAHIAEVGFKALLTIRHGYCPYTKNSFSFLPDFLIPFKRLAKTSLRSLIDQVHDGQSVISMAEEFGQSLSTTYNYLECFSKLLRMNRVLSRDGTEVVSAPHFLKTHSKVFCDWVWGRIEVWVVGFSTIISPARKRRRRKLFVAQEVWRRGSANPVTVPKNTV